MSACTKMIDSHMDTWTANSYGSIPLWASGSPAALEKMKPVSPNTYSEHEVYNCILYIHTFFVLSY